MIVTGESTSRLSELKKYKETGNLFDQHFLSNGSFRDGVNKNSSKINTIPQKIVYYIGGITYTDIIDEDNNINTTFKFDSQGYDSPDFVNYSIIKDFNKQNIVQKPKIDDGVFIERQQLSAFDKNYKLREIRNLVELNSYAGGKFFNIISNT